MEKKLKWIKKKNCKKCETYTDEVLRGEGGVGGACENFVCAAYKSISLLLLLY